MCADGNCLCAYDWYYVSKNAAELGVTGLFRLGGGCGYGERPQCAGHREPDRSNSTSERKESSRLALLWMPTAGGCLGRRTEPNLDDHPGLGKKRPPLSEVRRLLFVRAIPTVSPHDLRFLVALLTGLAAGLDAKIVRLFPTAPTTALQYTSVGWRIDSLLYFRRPGLHPSKAMLVIFRFSNY